MMARPAEDLRLHRAEMAAWSGVGELKPCERELRDWVAANDGCRRDVLAALRADGPLPTHQLPDTRVLSWRSPVGTGAPALGASPSGSTPTTATFRSRTPWPNAVAAAGVEEPW